MHVDRFEDYFHDVDAFIGLARDQNPGLPLYLLGHSMGGLISHRAMTEHGDVFSRIGILSPSYWVSEAVFAETDGGALVQPMRIWLQMGGAEGDNMIPNFERMDRQLRDQGFPADALMTELTPDGEHHESTWRSRLPDGLRFLFADLAAGD